jgi:hypothetical protein
MRPRNARILRELIDVAVRRAEVHPGITAFVLLSKEDFNPVGPKLTGGCSDIVNKEACNWTRRKVTIDVAVGSKDLHLATVRQLQHTEPRKIEFRSKAQDTSKKSTVGSKFSVRVPTQASLMIFTPYEYAHWLSMSTESEHSHRCLAAHLLLRSDGAGCPGASPCSPTS